MTGEIVAIVAISALAVLCLYLVIALVQREREHATLLSGLLDMQRDERETLQNKLVQPRVYQPTPSQLRPRAVGSKDPQHDRQEDRQHGPRDLGELARIGQIVGEPPDVA